MTKLRWTATVEVDGLFATTVVQPGFAAEAIDRIAVSIPAGASDHAVAIQPGGADALRLMLVKASAYSSSISYKLTGGTEVPLTGPQLFSGGALALFGGPVNTLSFDNGGADPVDVEILVARDAA